MSLQETSVFIEFYAHGFRNQDNIDNMLLTSCTSSFRRLKTINLKEKLHILIMKILFLLTVMQEQNNTTNREG